MKSKPLTRHQIYYQKNAEKLRVKSAARRAADPAAHNAACNASKRRNWDAYLEKKREPDRDLRLRVKRAAVDALGGCCATCGYSENIHALEIDHINSDGATERSVSNNNYRLYNTIIKLGSQGRYQCLCANCNRIKRFEKREYAKGRQRSDAA